MKKNTYEENTHFQIYYKKTPGIKYKFWKCSWKHPRTKKQPKNTKKNTQKDSRKTHTKNINKKLFKNTIKKTSIFENCDKTQTNEHRNSNVNQYSEKTFKENTHLHICLPKKSSLNKRTILKMFEKTHKDEIPISKRG